MEQIEEILEFWFGDTRRDFSCIPEWMEFWFTASTDLDVAVRQRFATDVADAAAGQRDHWAQTPSGRLALVLLLDQFTRNIYRGEPAAFACDDRALAFTQAGIVSGDDGKLGPVETAFLYMPMQHSESLAVQIQSVALYEALADSVPDSAKPVFQNGFAKYARLHRDIIVEFGRFPHRNGILGRSSSPEEKAYLAADAPTFGQ